MTMTSRARLIAAIGLAAMMLSVFAIGGAAQERKSIAPRDRENPLRKLISGYYFGSLETRALQDDDFDNPGFRWVQLGESLWSKAEGEAQKACSTCHRSASDTMRGIAVSYPKFDAEAGTRHQSRAAHQCAARIRCRLPLGLWLGGIAGDDRLCARAVQGNPGQCQIDGPAKPVFDAGKQLYESRMGQLGMSCALCHDKHYDRSLRGYSISQGHSNGFPAYQLETKTFVSLHGKFDACFGRMRAEPFAQGSPEYVGLELYLAWRGNGLPIETPAVRP